MEVLILSKTHFGKHVCVGGIVLENDQYVRLLNRGGWYQYADTEFNIGDVWDIQFSSSTDVREPHNEDVIIHSKIYCRRVEGITQFILSRKLPVWKGSISNIFDGKIRWASSGAGFLTVNVLNYPIHSIGFWLSDKQLSYDNEYYFYPTGSPLLKRKLKYKGIPAAVLTIPANTLLRVSLAKWWKPDDAEIEERCYLQLSGWYDYEDGSEMKESVDDLPF